LDASPRAPRESFSADCQSTRCDAMPLSLSLSLPPSLPPSLVFLEASSWNLLSYRLPLCCRSPPHPPRAREEGETTIANGVKLLHLAGRNSRTDPRRSSRRRWESAAAKFPSRSLDMPPRRCTISRFGVPHSSGENSGAAFTIARVHADTRVGFRSGPNCTFLRGPY
jgi:hypothetical protein